MRQRSGGRSADANEIVNDVMKVLHYGDESVSVAIEEVNPEEWADTVYKHQGSLGPPSAPPVIPWNKRTSGAFVFCAPAADSAGCPIGCPRLFARRKTMVVSKAPDGSYYVCYDDEDGRKQEGSARSRQRTTTLVSTGRSSPRKGLNYRRMHK
jgi:hypothetical protein